MKKLKIDGEKLELYFRTLNPVNGKKSFIIDLLNIFKTEGLFFDGGFIFVKKGNKNLDNFFWDHQQKIYENSHPSLNIFSEFISENKFSFEGIGFVKKETSKNDLATLSNLQQYLPKTMNKITEIKYKSPKTLTTYTLAFINPSGSVKKLFDNTKIILNFWDWYYNLDNSIKKAEDLSGIRANLELHQEELEAQTEELIESQKELKQALEYQNNIFDLAAVPLAETDGRGNITKTNQKGFNLFSIGQNILTLVKNDPRNKAKIAYYLNSNEKDLQVSTALLGNNNQMLHGDLNILRITVQQLDQKKGTLLLSFLDKTKEIELNKAINVNFLSFKAMVDASESHFMLIDNQHKIVIYNKVVKDLFAKFGKISLTEGIDIISLLEGEPKKIFKKGIDEGLKGNKFFKNFEALLNQQLKITVKGQFIPVRSANRLPLVAYIGQDITAEIEKEKEIRKLANIAERTENGVIITNTNLEIEWVNKGFEKITGYTMTEVLGLNPGKLLQTEGTDAVETQKVRKAIKERKAVSATLLNKSKMGKPYYIKLFIEPIFDLAGNLTNFFAIQTDVTNNIRQKQELELRAQELEKSKNELSSLVYRISHDLRAPILSVLGLINLMRMPQEHTNYIRHLDLQEESLKKLDLDICNIVDLVKNEQYGLDVSEVNAEEILKDCIKKFKYLNPQVQVNTELVTEARLKTDAYRLEVIISNLISNGLKYADRNKQDPFINIKLKVNKEVIELIYHDNGIGIDKENLNHVFKIFYRAHEISKGSGIGLFLVKEAINLLSGTINISSKPRVGTQIEILLKNHK